MAEYVIFENKSIFTWHAHLQENFAQHVLHTFDGVPRTLHTLKISSISLLPGNSGLSVYSSAMMQPTAQMSIGEL